MTDRPDPSRDFKAASDRFQQAMADAAEKTTAAEAEATLSAAVEDYNRAVDAYNAHAEQYNREHGLTEDDDAETLRYLVRNGDTATLEAKTGETTGGEQVQDDFRAVAGERDDFRAQLRTELAISAELRRRNDELATERCHAEADRDALAARVAELEAEREADTCAVGSLLEANDEDVPRAREYLRKRFSGRIDALIERDANEGAP